MANVCLSRWGCTFFFDPAFFAVALDEVAEVAVFDGAAFAASDIELT